MKAGETNLAELLEGRKQYLVPLYQRTYSWETKNLKQLWDDLQLLVERRQDNHWAANMVLVIMIRVNISGYRRKLAHSYYHDNSFIRCMETWSLAWDPAH